MKFIIVFACAMLLTGCADRVEWGATMPEQVGFLYGWWHGFILPFSWLVSVFDSDVAIYAVYNNGSWYDTGFVAGAASGLTPWFFRPS